MRVELYNDIIIQMEIDYGRIKILNRHSGNNIQTRYLIFLQCAYENLTTGGIKPFSEKTQQCTTSL